MNYGGKNCVANWAYWLIKKFVCALAHEPLVVYAIRW